jgi:Protein of unknown function (DUF2510)
MTDPNQSLPIAGWYPDPENDKGDRWWNGSSWSDHRRSREAAVGWAPVPTVAAPAPAMGAAAIPTAVGYERPNPYGTPSVQYGSPAYTQPYAPGYAQPYTPYATPASSVKNLPALVGFIISIAGMVFFLSAISGFAGGIVSIIGLQKARALAVQGVTVGNGRSFALAGIIIGFVSAIGSILIFALIVSSANQY